MINQGMCTAFKIRALTFVNPINMALYTANANLGQDTTVYTTAGEVVGTGYTAGGIVLVPTPAVATDTTAFVTFVNPVWPAADFICRGALIYDSVTLGAIAVLDFGSDKHAVGPFTVFMPLATATTAILRFANG